MSAQSGTAQQRGPKLIKGALVASDPQNPPPVHVVFQYNPSSLRRTLTPQMVGGEQGDRSEVVRFTGAPVETITLDIEIDALGAAVMANGPEPSGIAPQLAALELLAYPRSSAVTTRRDLLSQGTIEVAPMVAPAVQFVWGAKRVLPVRVLSFQVTEEEFDSQLNPLRATVGVSLRVLTYSDVAPDVAAYDDFITYQRTLETLAREGAGSPPV